MYPCGSHEQFFLFTPPPYTCIPVLSTFIDNGKPLSVVSVCRCVELCLGLVPSMVPECLTCQTTTRRWGDSSADFLKTPLWSSSVGHALVFPRAGCRQPLKKRLSTLRTLVGHDVLPLFDDPLLSIYIFFLIVLASSVSCSLSDTYDVTSTLRWCIASQYGLAPLHPLLFSVLLRPVPTRQISRRPTPIIGRLYCRVGRFCHRFCNSRPTGPIKHV